MAYIQLRKTNYCILVVHNKLSKRKYEHKSHCNLNINTKIYNESNKI